MPNLVFEALWRDRGATKGLRDLGTQAESTGKKVASAQRSSAHAQKTFAGFGGGIAKGMGAGIGLVSKFGVAAAGGFAVAGGAAAVFGTKVAASNEQARISFTTMLGSAAKADKLLRQLQKFSAETPFEFPEIAEAGKKLLAFGFTARDIEPNLRRLGDVASGLGIPLGELTDIYGKARVQGRLYMEDINQLTGRGIPIIQEFAKQFGVNESQVRKLVESGKIGFPQLQRAMESMTGKGGQFAGMMAAQSKSLSGLWSTFTDTLGQGLAGLATKAFPLMKDALKGVSGSLGSLFAVADRNSDSIAAIFRVAGSVLQSFGRISSTVLGSFSGSLGQSKAGFRDFADFIDTHQGDIVRAFVEGGKAAIALGRGILGMASGGLRAMGELDAGVSKITIGMVHHFGAVIHGAALAFRWVPGLGPKLRAADKEFAGFSSSVITKLEQNGKGAIAAADKIDNTYLPALAAADRKLKSVGEREIWKARQADAAARASHAIRDIGVKADGSQIKLKSWNERTRLGSIEQARLEGRIRAARQRMLEQRDAGIKAGDSQRTLTTRWNQGRAALEREFRQMGLSKEAAHQLAIRYSKIPKKAETKVSQPGMPQARRDTWDLDKRINNLNNKKVSITFETNAKKFGLTATELNAARRSRARGGILPGFTPVSRGDDQVVNMRSGEGVYVSEAMRNPYERHRLRAVNQAALAGRPLDQFQGLAAGGLVSRNVTARVGDPGISAATSRAAAMANAVALGMSYRVAQSLQKRLAALAGSGGGPIGGAGFANALRWARSQQGKPYIWTGVGPGGYDCSGFMSAIVNVIKGRSPFHRLFSTGMAGGQHVAGMTRNKMSPFRIGVWKNNPGHTAGTLNGVNVESSGGVGVRVGGRARGANNGLFNLHYGLARGGMVGDAPYDTTHRGGQRYDPETERLWKLLLGERGLHRGGVVRRAGVRMLSERGPERVLSARQTNAFERMVGAMDRGRGGGNTYNVTVNAPNYVGSNQDLVNTMVQMGKRGQMDVVLRSAGVRV